jgi:hypothetical protein
VTKRKPAHELTTEGAMRRLFPQEVRAHLRAAVREADAKADAKVKRKKSARGDDE